MHQRLAILLDIDKTGVIRDFKLRHEEEIEKFNLNPIGKSNLLGQCLSCASIIEISLYSSNPKQDPKQDSIFIKIEPDLDYVEPYLEPCVELNLDPISASRTDLKNEVVKYESLPVPISDDHGPTPSFTRKATRIDKTPKKRRPAACPTCKMIFPTIVALQGHLKVVHPELACSICSKQFDTSAALLNHAQKRHKGPQPVDPVICPICGKVYKCQKYLADHILNHQKPKPYECDICGTRKTIKMLMKRHMIEKHLESEFRCDVCKPLKQFADALTFQNHMNRHAKIKPFACEQCEMRFINKGALKSHVQARHVSYKERPKFHCSLCPRILLSKESLAYHESTHKDESERRWQCDSCPKTFGSKASLERHKLIHTDTRPFACNQCGRAFRSSQDLKTHMRLHTGEKPYQCPLESCQKRFSDRGCFRSHLKVHEKNLGVSLIKYQNPSMN